MIKPLLCCPSPRDIPEVKQALLNTEFDVVWAKYFTEQKAYETLRNFFLEHKEYTHMVICPDDLIVHQTDLEALMETIDSRYWPIVSGVCNVDLGKNKNKLSITENLPHPSRWMKKDGKVIRWGYRWYQWYEKDKTPKGCFRVPHTGFAAQFIRRDVVEKIMFMDDSKYNDDGHLGGGVDVMFSNACEWADIPLMVDTRVKMLHLRKPGPVDIILGNPEVHYRHDGKIFKFKTQTKEEVRKKQAAPDDQHPSQ